MRMRTHIRRGGFTLLEVLLASLLMSLLAMSLFGTLRIGIRARDTALASVGPARSLQLAMELTRQDLENAMSPTGLLAGEFIGDYGTEVNGTSHLVFYSVGRGARVNRAADLGAEAEPDPEWDGTDPTSAAGIHRIELLVRLAPELGNQQVLVRRVTRNLLAPVVPEPEEEILCRGVRSFVVRYLDLQNNGWTDVWDTTQDGGPLPFAVEVTLELDRPTGNAALSASGETREAAEGRVYKVTRTFLLALYRETPETLATDAQQRGAAAP